MSEQRKAEIEAAKNMIRNLKSQIKGLDTIQKTPSLPTKHIPEWKQSQLDTLRANHRIIVGKRSKTSDYDAKVLFLSHTKTLEMLERFRNSLKTFPEPTHSPSVNVTLDSPPCFLHSVKGCKSCRDTFGAFSTGTETEEGWQAHRLVFEKEAGEREQKHDASSLVVIDPKSRVSGPK